MYWFYNYVFFLCLYNDHDINEMNDHERFLVINGMGDQFSKFFFPLLIFWEKLTKNSKIFEKLAFDKIVFFPL